MPALGGRSITGPLLICIWLLHINGTAKYFERVSSIKKTNFTAQMKFALAVALLSLAAVQAAASAASAETAETERDGLGGSSAAVPKMIKPKYRSTAKRAIIRTGPFTLKAKGVSNLKRLVVERIVDKKK
jgi:hypothetical protein